MDDLSDVIITEPVEIKYGFGKSGVLFSEHIAKTVDPVDDPIGHMQALLDFVDEHGSKVAAARQVIAEEDALALGYVNTNQKWIPEPWMLQYLESPTVAHRHAAFTCGVHPRTIRRWRKEHEIVINTVPSDFQTRMRRYGAKLDKDDPKVYAVLSDTTLSVVEAAKRLNVGKSNVSRLRIELGLNPPPKVDWQSPEAQGVLRDTTLSPFEAAERLGVSDQTIYRRRHAAGIPVPKRGKGVRGEDGRFVG